MSVLQNISSICPNNTILNYPYVLIFIDFLFCFLFFCFCLTIPTNAALVNIGTIPQAIQGIKTLFYFYIIFYPLFVIIFMCVYIYICVNQQRFRLMSIILRKSVTCVGVGGEVNSRVLVEQMSLLTH